MAEPSKEKDSFSPKIFTTLPKNGKRRPNKKTQQLKNSMVKRQHLSIEKLLRLDGLLEGKMAKQTVRMPYNLREAFKRECKAQGVSTCKIAIELQTLWLINMRAKETAQSRTLNKIIDPKLSINGDIIFTQNVQSRVRRRIGNSQNVRLTVDGDLCCEIRDCNKPAVASGIYQKNQKTYRLCEHHTKGLVQSGGWRIL